VSKNIFTGYIRFHIKITHRKIRLQPHKSELYFQLTQFCFTKNVHVLSRRYCLMKIKKNFINGAEENAKILEIYLILVNL